MECVVRVAYRDEVFSATSFAVDVVVRRDAVLVMHTSAAGKAVRSSGLRLFLVAFRYL